MAALGEGTSRSPEAVCIPSFTFGIMSCEGDHSECTSDLANWVRSTPAEVRVDLFKSAVGSPDATDATDVLALNDMKFAQKIEDAFKDKYDMIEDRKTDGRHAILLKKDIFCPRIDLKLDDYFYKDKRYVFTHVKPDGWDMSSILMVSYHGEPNIKNEDAKEKLRNMLQEVLTLAMIYNADFVLIGGDFNYSVDSAKQLLREDETLNHLRTSSFVMELKSVRPRPKIIDYFIHSGSLIVKNARMKPFAEDALKRHGLSYTNVKQLRAYFDHDVIVVDVDVGESLRVRLEATSNMLDSILKDSIFKDSCSRPNIGKLIIEALEDRGRPADIDVLMGSLELSSKSNAERCMSVESDNDIREQSNAERCMSVESDNDIREQGLGGETNFKSDFKAEEIGLLLLEAIDSNKVEKMARLLMKDKAYKIDRDMPEDPRRNKAKWFAIVILCDIANTQDAQIGSIIADIDDSTARMIATIIGTTTADEIGETIMEKSTEIGKIILEEVVTEVRKKELKNVVFKVVKEEVVKKEIRTLVMKEMKKKWVTKVKKVVKKNVKKDVVKVVKKEVVKKALMKVVEEMMKDEVEEVVENVMKGEVMMEQRRYVVKEVVKKVKKEVEMKELREVVCKEVDKVVEEVVELMTTMVKNELDEEKQYNLKNIVKELGEKVVVKKVKEVVTMEVEDKVVKEVVEKVVENVMKKEVMKEVNTMKKKEVNNVVKKEKGGEEVEKWSEAGGRGGVGRGGEKGKYAGGHLLQVVKKEVGEENEVVTK